jgi:NNP family nitrate/nitrite transporter-like MFS transporter
MMLVFGQDHPAGRWSDRYLVATAGLQEIRGADEEVSSEEKKEIKGSEEAVVSVDPVHEGEDMPVQSTVDVAVNKSLTFGALTKILSSPLTWLPALAYLTTFGIELAIDSKMADILFSIYSKRQPGFTQTTAGYYTSILCVLVLGPWIHTHLRLSLKAVF